MKRILLSLLISGLFVQCSDALEESPKSFIAKSNFYKNTSDANAALTAVYGRLALRPDQVASAVALVANDKKNRGGVTRMSLLRRIGEARLGVEVEGVAVGRAVKQYLAG